MHIFGWLYPQRNMIGRDFGAYKSDIFVVPDSALYKDTLTDNFHIFLPQEQATTFVIGGIIPGSPCLPARFSQQPDSHRFWFLNHYAPYIKTHHDIVYYDTRKPFTLFGFSGNFGERELVKFVHTQNISPVFNFVFNYDLVNWTGQYQNSMSKVNALDLATAYTKRKYESHFNVLYNKIALFENGGIADRNFFESTRYPSNNYSVNLTRAENLIDQAGVQYSQEVRFGSYSVDTIYRKGDTLLNKQLHSRFSIVHDLVADRYRRRYSDVPGHFYRNIFIDSTATSDSTRYYTLDNSLLLRFNAGGNGRLQKLDFASGVKATFENYGFDTSTFQKPYQYWSFYVVGKFAMTISAISLTADISHCFAGLNRFNTTVAADISAKIGTNLGLSGYVDWRLLSPDLFYYNYRSNHFQWTADDLLHANTLKAGAKLSMSKQKLDAGFDVGLLDNYMVFGKRGLPQQVTTPNLVAEAFVDKTFKIWHFYWHNRLAYQFIKDRSKLPLPEYMAYTSLYFKKTLLQGILTMQFGVDVNFMSSVFGYGYIPALGAFYLQDRFSFGNYPAMGAFAVIKAKRLRFFLKVSNFNSTFMRQTYTLADVPINPLNICFGISWEFYD